MSTHRRTLLTGFGLVALALIVLPGHVTAHAAPPSGGAGADSGPLHVSPALKGPKGPQPKIVQPSFPLIPACLKERYKAFEATAKALKIKHATDLAAYEAEYAKAKQDYLGPKALAAAACTVKR